MYNDFEYKYLRRKLRKNQTEVERFLWHHLRGKRLSGLKFFRQYSFGSYILDFYCPSRRLAIELDGSQHMDESAEKYDSKRTKFLSTARVTVLRFWNNDVFKELKGVLTKIEMAANTPENPSGLRPPPL